MASPFPFQRGAIKHLIDILRIASHALDSSDTGFGKTFVALFVAYALGLRIAVICPKSVIPSWREAAEAVGVPVVFITNYEQIKLEKRKEGKWKIKRKKFQWNLDEETLLVFDEVHRCKSKNSQNAKLLVATRHQKFKTLMLSATCATNPMDMFALGYVLKLHGGHSDFFYWLRANGVVKGPFGLLYRGGPDTMRRLHDQIFPKKGSRVCTADIPGFPQNTVLPTALETGKTDAIETLLEALAIKKDQDVPLPIVEQLRLRQEVEMLKVPAITEFSKDLLAEGNSVVVFVNFRDTLTLLKDALKKAGVSEIVGGQDDADREQQIQDFQGNKNHVMLAMVQAGGVGVNLHDLHGRPRVSLVSPSYSATELRQALGRINRAGAKSPAIQHIIFAAGTIESQVRRTVQKKLDNLDALNDGDLML